MRRPRCTIFGRALPLALLGVASIAGADGPRPGRAADDAPIFVIVDGQDDLDSLRKKVDRPDFVILKGAAYDAMRAQAKGQATAGPPRGVVESVAIGGEVLEDFADLTVEFGIVLAGAEPAWVPIRLDGQVPSSARAGDRELPLRSVDGSWQVKVQGEGLHRVKVALSGRVLAAPGSPEGRRLEWAIPEAATTRLQLVVGPSAVEVAVTGPGGVREPLAVEAVEGGQRNRVSASLTPRKRLELSWQAAAEAGPAAAPPLLTAQGEIALEVERGSLRARSSWEVRSERGTVRRLELRVDPADELVGLECDGRPVLGDGPLDAASGAIGVPLAEPLRPGGTCRLVVTTRRVLSPETSSRLTYRGVPLPGVVAQSGVVAIAQRGGDPWVSASAGRGLRQIDPRSDLPATLRARPSIVLAYQFVEQPFDLGLQVDPSPPWVQVGSRATVTVEAGRARVDAWLDYKVPRGRVFEVRVALPEALALDLVGPEATVAASETLAEVAAPGRRRVLVARLTPLASEDGSFSIHLAGRQPIPEGGEASVGLPRPIGAQTRGGLIAVLAARSESVELGRNPSGPRDEFAPAGLEPPPSWPWPPERAIAAPPPALWLRHDESPGALPLKTSSRSRVVRESATLDARVDRRGLDVRQESEVRVRFGSLAAIDVEVPPEAEGAWEIDGAEVTRREPLDPATDGSARHRLTLGREVADAARLRFRVRTALPRPLDEGRATRLVIPRIKVLGAESGPPRVRVAADGRIDLEPEGEGWSAVADDALSATDALPQARLERSAGGPSAILARARATVMLPKAVASRLWLRTTLDPAGGLRTSATYRVEGHDGALSLAVPPGATWERARVGGEAVAEVEGMPGTAGAYRIKLPPSASGPVVVAIDYAQAASTSPSWSPPRLLEGGLVQECYWEARVPWNVAMVGVPPGWSDANCWVWSTYAFMRRPGLSAEGLSSWVAGPSPETSTAEDADRVASHAYLFSRVGDPSRLRPTILSRAGLVGLCSGAVLAIGLVMMLARTPARVAWLLLPIAALAAAVLVPPSVIALVVQSSLLGVALVSVAAATQRFVERRTPASPSFAESSGLVISGAARVAPPAEVGSDDSTVVRGRAGTTVDHAPAGVASPEGSGAS